MPRGIECASRGDAEAGAPGTPAKIKEGVLAAGVSFRGCFAATRPNAPTNDELHEPLPGASPARNECTLQQLRHDRTCSFARCECAAAAPMQQLRLLKRIDWTPATLTLRVMVDAADERSFRSAGSGSPGWSAITRSGRE